MSDFKQSFPKHKPFKCGHYWHFRKSGLYLAVYDLVGSVTAGGTNEFFSTIDRVRIYFGSSYEVTRRVFKNLVKQGWFEYDHTIRHYRYVSHDDWAKTHPDQCTKRELLPWQVETDPLVGRIYAACGGKIGVFENQIIAIRKLGITDEEFLGTLRKEIAEAKERRALGEYGGTSAKQCFWRVFNELKWPDKTKVLP